MVCLSIYRCHPCCPYHGRNGQWCAWLRPNAALLFLCVVVVICPFFFISSHRSFSFFLSLFSFLFILLSFDDTNPSHPYPSLSLSTPSILVLILPCTSHHCGSLLTISPPCLSYSVITRTLSHTLARSRTPTPSDSLPRARSHLPLIPRVSPFLPSLPFLSFPSSSSWLRLIDRMGLFVSVVTIAPSLLFFSSLPYSSSPDPFSVSLTSTCVLILPPARLFLCSFTIGAKTTKQQNTRNHN
ncbi:MAG: hypothetical protein BYD32DRAFT_174972 [Podila humilis]|nr:MAG: hypothetical protein BYD32DRAFT_174972 [Podila humilis]